VKITAYQPTVNVKESTSDASRQASRALNCLDLDSQDKTVRARPRPRPRQWPYRPRPRL